jgi:hypothetical protein
VGRRTLARLDAEALAAVIGTWLADRHAHPDRHDRRRRAVAVDGKTLRGTRCAADGRQFHLLGVMDHTTRALLAQRQVDGAPGEVPAFQPLLADPDLAGVVVTANALHTHAGAAEFLVTGKQAHYLFQVKANQPILLERCAGCPGTAGPWATAPATAPASSCAPLRPSPSTTSGSHTPPRSSRSPATPASCAPGGGGP